MTARGALVVDEFEALIRQSGGAMIAGVVSVERFQLQWQDNRVVSANGPCALDRRAASPAAAGVAATDSRSSERGRSRRLVSYCQLQSVRAPADDSVCGPGARRKASETGLQLRLSGVLVGRQPQSSGAIVAQNNGDAAYYRVGDALPGNAQLMEVEPGRIFIRRNGQYETLILKTRCWQPAAQTPKKLRNRAAGRQNRPTAL